MTQTVARQSGTDLASDWPTNWNNFLDSLLTSHSGTARPSFVQAGTIWYNTSTKYLNYYDGAQDIALFAIDPTNHLLNPPIGGGIGALNSAATTDLGSIPQAAISISGTVAITSFGNTVKPGQIKVLTFAGALTLTHGASLLLPGNANITTAAGDTAIVLCTSGGNYRCIAYQAANSSAVAPGTIIMYGASAAPQGYLECDGSAVSRTTYDKLFTAIGTTHGAGDGSSTFNLPDYRGQFLRGWDHGRGVDAGRAFGSSQADAFGSHAHAITDPGHSHSATVTDPSHAHSYTTVNTASGAQNPGTVYRMTPAGLSTGAAVTGISVGVNGAVTNISIQANGSSETRPKNMAVLFCIKY